VTQSDLGEYEESAREKQNIQYTRQSTDSPSNQVIWMANIKFWTQEGSNQTTRFLNAKEHTSPKTKANHKLDPLAIHNKKNMDHKGNSSQNRGGNQPTESHIYTGDNHHDGTTWVITKALWHNVVNNSSRTRSKYNLTDALHKRWTNQAASKDNPTSALHKRRTN
jgi:hypothetical protein